MLKEVHLLNGDALAERFPKQLTGTIIVFRECLVDGPVSAATKEDWYRLRAQFMSSYEGVREEDYFQQAVPELEKLRKLSADHRVYCWFEDDLFCQVNLWYSMHQLSMTGAELYWVQTKREQAYGFSYCSDVELIQQQQKAVWINPHSKLYSLWPLYQQQKIKELKTLALHFNQWFPQLVPAIEALEILQNGDFLAMLSSILQSLNQKDFSSFFKAFQQQAPIYGFGDLQLKRYFDQLMG